MHGKILFLFMNNNLWTSITLGNDISVNKKSLLPLAKGEVKVSTSILSPNIIMEDLCHKID